MKKVWILKNRFFVGKPIEELLVLLDKLLTNKKE